MSTLYESEKTHQQMLPQSADAEAASAGDLKGKDETRCGRLGNRATVVQHGRAETVGDHLSLQRYSANLASVGEAGDRGLVAPPGVTGQRVLVLDMHGQPLMPCSLARARKLLHAERSRVHRLVPFVIRLVDRAAEQSELPGVEVDIDPGSKFTGVSVFTADDECVRCGLVSIEIEHRRHLIHKLTGQSRAYRRRRRTENLHCRKPRWAKRHPESCASCGKNARHESRYCQPCAGTRSFVDNDYGVDSTISVLSRLRRCSPARAIHQELVRFDLQKIENQEITGVCYQQGTMALYEVREYLLEKWGRKCAYCKASEVPLQIEHIFTKSRGGTNRVSNLMFACSACNNAKDNLSIEVFLVKDPQRLARILAQANALLKDVAGVNATRWALWRGLKNTGVVVFGGSRGRTKWNRSRFSVPKPHALDVVCVRNTSGVASYPTRVLATKAAGRGFYALTRSDVYGSPRLYLPLTKVHHRFATGDLVLAVVPTGNLAGVYVGRVAVCSSGSFNIKAKGETVQGISYRYCTLLRHSDGWGYEQQQELGPAARVRLSLSTARVGGFSSHTHF